jgi:RHS repeat-associated protein
VYFIEPDHLATPRLIADENQKTVWRWDNQEPFGNDMPNEDPDGDGVAFDFPMRFPGQYFDRETGLAYNYFRDYSAEIGRYVQSDPVGLLAGTNTNLYVGANPLAFADLKGLLQRVVRYEFQIWEYSVTIGSKLSKSKGDQKRKDRWVIYASIPDCWVEIGERTQRYDIGLGAEAKVSPKAGGDKDPTPIIIATEAKLYWREMKINEYIYGPGPRDPCCKGVEQFAGYDYTPEPKGVQEFLKNLGNPFEFFFGK